MNIWKAALLATATTALVAGTVATAAYAKNGDGVRAAGTCTKTSAAKLKLSPDNGSIETEFEVDQNRTGVRWKVVLFQQGKVVLRTSRVTQAPSGSFTVRRLLADHAGTDRISARATSPSGEVCKAAAALQ